MNVSKRKRSRRDSSSGNEHKSSPEGHRKRRRRSTMFSPVTNLLFRQSLSPTKFKPPVQSSSAMSPATAAVASILSPNRGGVLGDRHHDSSFLDFLSMENSNLLSTSGSDMVYDSTQTTTTIVSTESLEDLLSSVANDADGSGKMSTVTTSVPLGGGGVVGGFGSSQSNNSNLNSFMTSSSTTHSLLGDSSDVVQGSAAAGDGQSFILIPSNMEDESDNSEQCLGYLVPENETTAATDNKEPSIITGDVISGVVGDEEVCSAEVAGASTLFSSEVDSGTSVLVGQDGTFYAVDSRVAAVHSEQTSEQSRLDSDLIFKGTPFEIKFEPKPTVEFTKVTGAVGQEASVAEHYKVKITTGPIAIARGPDDEYKKFEAHGLLIGISHGEDPELTDPQIFTRKNIHIDAVFLDSKNACNVTLSNDGSPQATTTPAITVTSAVRASPLDMEIDKSLRTILVPLGGNGFMTVYGRSCSVDDRIKERYPIANVDLCRALVPVLVKNGVLHIGVNVLLFGETVFVATVDFLTKESRVKLDISISDPHEKLHQMRECGYTFVEINGYESEELAQTKIRSLRVVGLNQMNQHHCIHCKKSYKSTTSLVSHMSRCDKATNANSSNINGYNNNNTRLFLCPYCDYFLYSLASYCEHWLARHTEQVRRKLRWTVGEKTKSYLCFMCSKNIRPPNLGDHLIKTHYIIVNSLEQLLCLTCDHTCDSAADMRTHKQTQHTMAEEVEVQKQKELDAVNINNLNTVLSVGAGASPKSEPHAAADSEDAAGLESSDKMPTASFVISDSSSSTARSTSSSSTGGGRKRRKSMATNHKCGMCASMFSSKKQVMQHLITHTGLRPFVCEICNEVFAFRRTLVRHGNDMHPEISTQYCLYCGEHFETQTLLRKHECVAVEGPFSCPHCNWKTHIDIRLFRHLASNHSDITSKYYCSYCKQQYPSINKLRYHQRSVHKELLQRQINDKERLAYKKYYGNNDSENPVKDQDVTVVRDDYGRFVYVISNPELGQPVSKNKPVPCSQCNMVCSTKNALRRHIITQHPEVPVYKCHECSIVFKNNSDYCDHHKKYHKPKPLFRPKLISPLRWAELSNMQEKLDLCRERVSTIHSQVNELEMNHSSNNNNNSNISSPSQPHCKICKVRFESDEELLFHQKYKHMRRGRRLKRPHRKVYVCRFDSKCSIQHNHLRLIKDHLTYAHKVEFIQGWMYEETTVTTNNKISELKVMDVSNSDGVVRVEAGSKLFQADRYKCENCTAGFAHRKEYLTHISANSCDKVTGIVKQQRMDESDNSSDIELYNGCGDDYEFESVTGKITLSEIDASTCEVATFKELRVCDITNDDMLGFGDDCNEIPRIKQEPLDDDVVEEEIEREFTPTQEMLNSIKNEPSEDYDDTDIVGKGVNLHVTVDGDDIKEEIEVDEAKGVISMVNSIVRVGAVDPLTISEPADVPSTHDDTCEDFVSINHIMDERDQRVLKDRHNKVLKKKGRLMMDVKGLIPKRKNSGKVNGVPVSKVKAKRGRLQSKSAKETPVKIERSPELTPEEKTELMKAFPKPIKIEVEEKAAPNKKVSQAKRKQKSDENVAKVNGKVVKNRRKRVGIICEKCNEKFETRAELSVHIRYDH